MHQALNLAKAQGKAPGALTDTVQSAHDSRLDWLTLLRRYMTDASRSDYTWSVPNHRFIDSGLYLPSLHSYGLTAIAVLIDTSGSLPAETLANFWTAIRDLASEIRADTIVVLQIDTAVRDAAQYDSAGLPTEMTIKGRGGTDFRPGFEWLQEERIHPSVCVYLTDMLCSSYPDTHASVSHDLAELWRAAPTTGTANPGANASTSRPTPPTRRKHPLPCRRSSRPPSISSTNCLTPTGKPPAAWYREHCLDHYWYEYVFDDFETICGILGIALGTSPVHLHNGKTRDAPHIYFRGFWSQGDGACFAGAYAYASNAKTRDPHTRPQRCRATPASPTPFRLPRNATSTSSAPSSRTAATTATITPWRSNSNAKAPQCSR